MTNEEIQKVAVEMLKKIAPDTEPEKLAPDDDIRYTLEIDSFDALQFVVALDEHFKLDIPEEDYGKITTMKKLVQYIQQKKSQLNA